MTQQPGEGRRLFGPFVGLLVVAGVGAVLGARALQAPAGPPWTINWVEMIAPFAIFQIAVVNVQLRREARSVSLSEIPIALGLVCCSPFGFAAARVIGGVLVYTCVQRQYRHPVKLMFNTALAVFEAGLALLVFHAVVGTDSSIGARAWVAVIVANVAVSCTAAMAVTLVIQLFESSVSLREIVEVLPASATQAAVVSVFGLIALVSVQADPAAIALLVVGSTAAVIAYRAYAKLSERHLTLERVYRFTQAMSNNGEMSDILLGVLTQARDMLQGEEALLTFLVPEEQGIEISLGRVGTLKRSPVTILTADETSPIRRALVGDAAVLVPRDVSDPATVQWLTGRGLREIVAAPLRGASGAIAVLAVADRLGEARGFDQDDVKLLETVANHASIALQNGRLVDQLRHESQHDILTGLPNRLFFQRAVDRDLVELPHGRVLAVGLLDLDDFKDVNDTLGHTAGDELLCEIAKRLSVAAGPDVVIARLGGDEFAVAYTAASTAAALDRGAELVACLRQPVLLSEVEVEVGGSLGLATTETSGCSRETLLKHADTAMYRAKTDIRDVALYEPTAQHATADRLALVGRLRAAIEENRIEVFVQPQVAIASGALVGAEALVRWRDPDRGHISPDEFIPLAERSGLIRPLTDTVLQRSVSACAAWQSELPGVGIAVNISVKSLTEDALVDRVSFLLRRYSLDPALLTLEITESSIMSEPARMLAVLKRLTQLGVRLSIDDFGTGYSSLSYLQRLPVCEVKIDRSFVTDLSHNSDNAAIARSIVDLAGALSLDVVAEGIESVEDWDLLGELKCTTGQGHLIAKPMPIELVTEWHARWRPPRGTLTIDAEAPIAIRSAPESTSVVS
jgi:diguanylate cyclase (GGDEF)-like protein